MSQPEQPEFIEVDGKRIPVSRTDMRTEVKRVAQSKNCSDDEAWAEVKRDLLVFFQTGKIRKDWGRVGQGDSTKPQDPDFDAFADEGRATRTELFLSAEPPSDASELLLDSPASATQQAESTEFSDEMLPEHLRGSGMNWIQAVTKGLITAEGEHPDAALLRQAAAENGGMFAPPDLNNKPAIRAVRERQLAFPFKVPLNVRIMPTDFNQTSLFHVASNNTPRRFYKGEIMGRIGDTVSLYFYGEEMRHDDEANFLQLLHLARGKAPYDWIFAENVPFIRGSRGSRRKLGAKDSNGVDESLERMRGAYVLVRNAKRKSYITINLIRDLQGAASERRIMIDPCMVALLDSYTTMDQDVLYDLRGVARQLFKYISTKPYSGLYPTKVTSFFEICYGTQDSIVKHYRERNPTKTDAQVRIAMTKKISDFRSKALPEALDELKSRRLIVDYKWDKAEDKVSIVKSPPSNAAVGYEAVT